MEQATQTFNRALLIIPLLLSLIPAILFYAGYRASRIASCPFAGKALYWMGGHGITIVLITLLTALRGAGLPGTIIIQLPLIITALYLCSGLALNRPFIFSLGLATPLIWFLLTKVCEVFSGAKHIASNLPEEPFWYLLAALVIFGMRYLKKPKAFWEKSEYFLIVISSCCLMTAFWLMATGQPSLMAIMALPHHVWALALLFSSATLLWCAKHMADTLFGICSLIGVASGIYTFISSYPWK